MPSENVFMNVPEIRTMSRRFDEIGGHLEMAANTLQSLMDNLKATAFFGAVGSAALANYLEQLKPVIDTLSQKCQEMSRDLENSATAYENNDANTSTYF